MRDGRGRQRRVEIAPPDLERVEAQFGADQVDHPLGRVDGHHGAHAAVGPDRAAAARQGPAPKPDRRQAIGREERGGGGSDLERGRERVDRIGAGVGHHLRLGGQDQAPARHRDPEVDARVVGMGGRGEVLPPVLDPANRAPEPAGQRGHDQLLGEDGRLQAEAAPDVRHQHTHRGLLHAERPRRRGAHQVGDLGGGEELDPPPRGSSQHSSTLERQRGLAGGFEGLLEDAVGVREALLDPAVVEPEGVEDAVGGALVQRRLGRQRLVIHLDGVGQVFRQVAVRCPDHGHGLARIAHPVQRQRVPGAGCQARPVDAQRLQTERGPVSAVGARQRDRPDAGVRMRRAHERRLETVERQVGEVSAPARHEAASVVQP